MFHIDAHKAETQESTHLNIHSSGNAENIIRGLIHEGYRVTIEEAHDEKRLTNRMDVQARSYDSIGMDTPSRRD